MYVSRTTQASCCKEICRSRAGGASAESGSCSLTPTSRLRASKADSVSGFALPDAARHIARTSDRSRTRPVTLERSAGSMWCRAFPTHRRRPAPVPRRRSPCSALRRRAGPGLARTPRALPGASLENACSFCSPWPAPPIRPGAARSNSGVPGCPWSQDLPRSRHPPPVNVPATCRRAAIIPIRSPCPKTAPI
jgi:hypothetical protein